MQKAVDLLMTLVASVDTEDAMNTCILCENGGLGRKFITDLKALVGEKQFARIVRKDSTGYQVDEIFHEEGQGCATTRWLLHAIIEELHP